MKKNLATWAGGSGDYASEPVFDTVAELRNSCHGISQGGDSVDLWMVDSHLVGVCE